MVLAYLRGLLKPQLTHGLHSLLAEELMLDALSAEIATGTFERNILSDSALMTALTEESRKATLTRIQRQAVRVGELKRLDIYAVTRDRAVYDTSIGRISILRLFQAMQEQGILEAGEERPFDETLDGDGENED